MSKFFLFPDVETTGLEPSEDALLEVAWILTDEDFVPVAPIREFVIDLQDDRHFAAVRSMSTFVRDMHTASGLLDHLDRGHTVNLDRVFTQLMEDLAYVKGIDDTIHVAGFSVHFDVDFLKANDFDSLFRDFGARKAIIHHRHLDLSSVKMMIAAAGLTDAVGYPTNLRPHRAGGDVMEGLDYARMCRDFLRASFPFPPVSAEQELLDDLDPDVVTVDLTEYKGDL